MKRAYDKTIVLDLAADQPAQVTFEVQVPACDEAALITADASAAEIRVFADDPNFTISTDLLNGGLVVINHRPTT